ncbi:hypothetical protein [Ruminococcus flavefaciens]|uniref:Uncharacterized protein n=1 Tax=Ruminococcus flavefaciens 007c TaxID=1341157 RepID=W7UYA2_RUMFL|nr:hypothetical protein [Ruminococcus flavefaciens]EWM53610.1 hypothetical protein RF007C_06000 [Ruminococcus flavefaciens 007c]
MKDQLDYLFSDNDDDIERIADKYKAAGEKEKEKIYEKSKRKYNIMKDEDTRINDDGFIKEAEGVERYNRPSWIRFICGAAAAFVLLGGALGGVLLSRSQKVQHMDHGSDVEELSTDAIVQNNNVDKNEVVDTLISNYEQIMRTQYPVGADNEDHIWFKVDVYDETSDSTVNKTREYYAVTDNELDTHIELTSKLSETFCDELYNDYLGKDFSNFEVGYDFEDDSRIEKYLAKFIVYNDKIYALSLIEPTASYDKGFEELYNFSEYKLISSKFTEGGKLLSGDTQYFSEKDEPEAYKGLVTCKRVYERADGGKVTAEIQIIPKDESWRIAAFDVNADLVEKTVPEPTTQPAEETHNEEEFAELQLHERRICASYEEAKELVNELEKAWQNGTYTFKKIDKEKYIKQIISSENTEELNSVENKSYVYHMLNNGFRYYDTADASYEETGEENGSYYESTERSIADNRGKYMYNEFVMNSESGNDHITWYINDTQWITVDHKTKFYTEDNEYVQTYETEYVPDNDRIIECYAPGGEIILAGAFTNCILTGCSNECLHPDADGMFDFDTWFIEGTEEFLGRECVAIHQNNSRYNKQMLVDMRTGIIMRSVCTSNETGDTQTMKVTSIEIDKPIEYKTFDPTGYEPKPTEITAG